MDKVDITETFMQSPLTEEEVYMKINKNMRKHVVTVFLEYAKNMHRQMELCLPR
jgi:hypothetical protein